MAFMRLILLIAVLAPVPAEAQTQVAALSPADLEIYHATYFDCENTSVRENLHRLAGRARFESAPLYYGAKEALMGRWLKWNSHLESMLASPGFKLALDQCIGADHREDGSLNRAAVVNKRVFVADLMITDIAGKIAIGASLYRISKLFGSALKFLKGYGTAGRYAYWAGQIGMGAWFGDQIFYKIPQQVKQAKELEDEKHDPALKAAMDDYRAGKITKDQIGNQYAEYVKRAIRNQSNALVQAMVNMDQSELNQIDREMASATDPQQRQDLQNKADKLKTEISEMKLVGQ